MPPFLRDPPVQTASHKQNSIAHAPIATSVANCTEPGEAGTA